MLPSPILTFIRAHRVLTLATVSGDQPWVSSCYFVFDKNKNRFIIYSPEDSRHIQEGLKNPKVAGNIHIATKRVGILRGLQFEGTLTEADRHSELMFFRALPTLKDENKKIWHIDVTYAKYIDNRTNRFGEKLEFKL